MVVFENFRIFWRKKIQSSISPQLRIPEEMNYSAFERSDNG